MGALLGRDAELAALESALDDARLGRGRLFLLVGEPGIGKTRLADELCARAGDARVLWGRCWEAGGAPAYWPWIEALRPLLLEREPAALAAELGAAAVAVAALVPELRARLPGLPAAPPEDSEASRFALYDAMARFLRGAAARAPLLLVLDDLHVADRPSLRLLEFVARGLRGARLLIVGTYRDADSRLIPDVASLLAGIEREGQRLPLRRLREDEVAAFIADVSGAAPDPEMLAAVVRATEGTPLFVSEVVRVLVADAAGGRAGAPAQVLVPDGAQSAIRAHLARVSDEARAALRVAAVVGRDFAGAVVAQALAAPTDVRAALAEAARAGLLRELHDEPGRFRFSHILVRETVYRDIEEDERARVHGRVALALEALGGAGEPHRLAELSHHFARAGAHGDLDKAVLYCRRAGERALRGYAHEEAAALFQDALEALRGDAPDTERTRAELLLAAAEAHQRAGDGARARVACERAAASARRLGDAELLGRVALRLGAEYAFAFVDGTLVGMLEEALSGLGEARTGLRARLMARLAAARQPAPDPDQPIALAARAVALARAVGDRAALAAVLRDARAAHLPLDDLDQRLALDLETLAVAYETGDRAAALQALWRLSGDRLEQGNVPAALSHLDQMDALATELREPHRRLWSLLMRAGIASSLGDFAGADRWLGEADAVAARSQDPNAALFALSTRAAHLATATRLDELRAVVRALLGTLAARDAPDSRLFAATMRARAATDEELPAAVDAIPFDEYPARFRGQHALAEVYVRARRAEPAAILYQRLLPLATRFCAEGCYAHHLGLLATVIGRPEDARRHLEDAVALHERAGARPWVAHSLVALAEMDPARAGELRGRARGIAEALGMPGLLARLGVTASAPAPRPRAAPEPIAFELEGETWAVRFEGATYHFKDSKGLQIVACLTRNPGRELHVLHLAGVAAGHDGADALVEAAAVAGADAPARAAYQARAADLREALREAEANDDVARAARAREELDALAEELARGVGLGGRERRTGGSAERARINVQRRIADALGRIEDACPALGRRLSRAIRTGAYCVYEPAD